MGAVVYSSYKTAMILGHQLVIWTCLKCSHSLLSRKYFFPLTSSNFKPAQFYSVKELNKTREIAVWFLQRMQKYLHNKKKTFLFGSIFLATKGSTRLAMSMPSEWLIAMSVLKVTKRTLSIINKCATGFLSTPQTKKHYRIRRRLYRILTWLYGEDFSFLMKHERQY